MSLDLLVSGVEQAPPDSDSVMGLIANIRLSMYVVFKNRDIFIENIFTEKIFLQEEYFFEG